MIELSISVTEVRESIKDIVEAPGRIFDIMRFNVRETVGPYLSLLMESKLSREFSNVLTAEGISRFQFCLNVPKNSRALCLLDRKRYKRARGTLNYRNGAYHRRFTIKGVDMGTRSGRTSR